mgnify:CR=1 FL=1|jgi:hypothetical protein
MISKNNSIVTVIVAVIAIAGCVDPRDTHEFGGISSSNESVSECFIASDCLSDHRCDGGQCVYDPPECREDRDCPDDQVCDEGECTPEDPECIQHSDCPDEQVCNGGVCTAPAPPDCSEDRDCPRDQQCLDGRCTIEEEPEPEDQCDSIEDCLEGEVCIDGRCFPQVPDDPEGCEGDRDCEESERCVNSVCEFFCRDHSHCADESRCTRDACDFDTGACQNSRIDCADDDIVTLDFCDEESEQENPCTYLECVSEDLCFQALWQGNRCVTRPVANCGDGTVCEEGACVPAPCESASDCPNNNPCERAICEGGLCDYEPSHQCEEEGQFCDGNSGDCITQDPCPESCDDADEATFDFCDDEGECQHFAPVECEEGTAPDPNTGICHPVDNPDSNCDPEEEEFVCRQFGDTRRLHHFRCVQIDENTAVQISLDDCGPIEGARCRAGDGCQPRQ